MTDLYDHEGENYEKFLDLIDSDTDFEGQIYVVFGEPWDHYRLCKDDIRDESILEVAHAHLWEFDCEGCYYSLQGTLEAYEEHEKKAKA